MSALTPWDPFRELDELQNRLATMFGRIPQRQGARTGNEAAMAKAEKLAETDRRDAKQNEELSTLLSSVRTEIEMAQILGYGKKADFKPIFDQVKSIEQKSAGGKSGKGWFDELKTRIQKLF